MFVLGSSWVRLGVVFGRLGAVLDRLGVILGWSWGVLERLGGGTGSLLVAVGRPLKIIEKSLFFKGFAGLRASRRGGVAVLKRLGAIWDDLGTSLGVFERS